MNQILFSDEIIYHIYSFGMCASLYHNDFCMAHDNKLQILEGELENIKNKGFTTILFGPVCESIFHGYDTVDYFNVDRRLGNNQMMKSFCKKAHELGLKIIFDAVFNHTGRLFFAFKDIQKNREKSKFLKWYKNIDFLKNSEFNDGFDYEGWQGSKDLVKLNLTDIEVQNYLFSVIDFWIKEFDVDGLRVDAAHLMDKTFLRKIAVFSKNLKPDFWLLGEVFHGDYNQFIKKSGFDSCTDYQLYQRFFDCFNKADMRVLGNELEIQFGSKGLYKNLNLYIFADNQDVNRIASNLVNPFYLIPLYLLLFTLPGIPSIYYGSEYGLKGSRTETNDNNIRIPIPPFCDRFPDWAYPEMNLNVLLDFVMFLCDFRKMSKALKYGSLELIKNTKSFICYMRRYENEEVLVAVNIGDKSTFLNLDEVFFNEFSLQSEPYEQIEKIKKYEFKSNEIYLLSNKSLNFKTEVKNEI